MYFKRCERTNTCINYDNTGLPIYFALSLETLNFHGKIFKTSKN